MGIEGIGGPSSFGTGGGGGAGKILHTVQQGDTLDGVAKQYGVSLDELLNSNPDLKLLTELKPGQILDLMMPAGDLSRTGTETAADKLEPYDPGRFGFNPQPEPPGGILNPGTIKGFNPQPEPPGELLDPGSIVGFNPQPDPPLEPKAVSELNFSLAVDQFRITDRGHLLIKNEALTGLFKSLKEGSSEPINYESKSFSWGERPGEQLMFNFAAEQVNFEPQDFHTNELGEGVIENNEIGKVFDSVLQRQTTGLLNFTITTKPK